MSNVDLGKMRKMTFFDFLKNEKKDKNAFFLQIGLTLSGDFGPTPKSAHDLRITSILI